MEKSATRTVYSTYVGSQQGVAVRDGTTLMQSSYYASGVAASGIAATPSGDAYIIGGNRIIRYSADGVIQQELVFPDSEIKYSAIATDGVSIYAAYTGKQRGVTVRDTYLNEIRRFDVDIDATGVATDLSGNLYLSSGNRLHRHATDGTITAKMSFPDAGVSFTAIALAGDAVYASYSGSQHGVTIRNAWLGQVGSFEVDFVISGIAAGNNDDLFLASANSLYLYSTSGTRRSSIRFPDAIEYTAVAVIPAAIASNGPV